MSTTLREAERVIGFSKTAFEIDGVSRNGDNQIKYQVLLIKNRFYLSPDNSQLLNGLNTEQISKPTNLDYALTYDDALSIFNSKNYEDPPMRGRQSMSPLKKLGLVYIKENKVGKIIHEESLFLYGFRHRYNSKKWFFPLIF